MRHHGAHIKTFRVFVERDVILDRNKHRRWRNTWKCGSCSGRMEYIMNALFVEQNRGLSLPITSLEDDSRKHVIVVTGPEVDFESPHSSDTLGGSKDFPVWNLLTHATACDPTDLNTKEDELEIEIKQYMIAVKRARPTFESDPLAWWRAHKGHYPRIFSSVSQYLVCPASSVDCERLFSMAGIIYGNKRRGSLKGEQARLLLMLKAKDNADVGRVSKEWSPGEAKRYVSPTNMEDIYFDDECETSSSEDESSTTDEEETHPTTL